MHAPFCGTTSCHHRGDVRRVEGQSPGGGHRLYCSGGGGDKGADGEREGGSEESVPRGGQTTSTTTKWHSRRFAVGTPFLTLVVAGIFSPLHFNIKMEIDREKFGGSVGALRRRIMEKPDPFLSQDVLFNRAPRPWRRNIGRSAWAVELASCRRINMGVAASLKESKPRGAAAAERGNGWDATRGDTLTNARRGG